MTDDRVELPEGWEWACLGDMCAINPRHEKGVGGDDTPVSFVPMAAVDHREGAISGASPRPYGQVRTGFTHFVEGDVLFARITPCMENGKVAIARGLVNGLGCGTTEFHVLRPLSGILPEYIYRYLRQESFRRAAAANMSGTAGQLRVPTAYLKSVELPLAPLSEQRSIVAKIEALFDQSRTARQALDRIPVLLKKFRKAVLAAAFRGDLTREWREQHPDDEPASELLERIRAARVRRWQEELRSAKREGRRPPKKPANLDPPALDMSTSPELPRDWAWASVEFLASPEPRSIQSGPFGSNLRHSEFQDKGVLAIGIDNVLDGRFTSGSQHRISQRKYQQLKKYTARPLDVLITVMATVGRCCLVPEDIETAIITKHVYRISVDPELCVPNYLMNALRGCPPVQEQLYGKIQGVTRPGINGEILKRLLIPVAPLAEQHAIVSCIETLLNQAEKIDGALRMAQQQADKLEQSILSRAFRGELVAQDPNDEPASVLLARIRMGGQGILPGRTTVVVIEETKSD